MRKVEANRQNALKSTGPRTPKGKEYTGRNAIKHGLLVSPTRDFRALDEDPQEYEDLLNGLWDQHQPVGRAEELEVERIAQCWWRLKRAWRYENAGNLGARRTLETRMPLLQKNHGKELDQREAAVILQLRRAQKEIQDTGEISQALRQRIVALMPALEGVWLTIDKDAQERAKVLEAAEGQKLSSQTRSLIVASTVTELTAMVEHMGKLRWSTEVATGQQAIPGFALLDCLLRYEAATDRILNRALDRLERLQRRRKDKEERIPRSESLRLTQ
jgi:hypothetical protein